MFKINCVLRTFLLLFIVSFLLACALVCRAEAPDANALLKRSDAYRNGWTAYVLKVKITHFESGKEPYKTAAVKIFKDMQGAARAGKEPLEKEIEDTFFGKHASRKR